jgi:hypothetical protein
MEGGDNLHNSVRAVRKDDRYYETAVSKVVTTGQSASYDGDGNVIEVAPGDDYYGQDAQYESPDFSYTDNGDGTVTDNNTGLIWQVVPSDEHMSIEEATQYCEDLELGGRTDWRLPTAEELFSLSDFSTGWPYVESEYFEFPAKGNFAPPPGSGPQGGPSGGPQG